MPFARFSDAAFALSVIAEAFRHSAHGCAAACRCFVFAEIFRHCAREASLSRALVVAHHQGRQIVGPTAPCVAAYFAVAAVEMATSVTR